MWIFLAMCLCASYIVNIANVLLSVLFMVVILLIYLFIHPSIHPFTNYFLCWIPVVYQMWYTKIKRLTQHMVRPGVPPAEDGLTFRQVLTGSGSLPDKLHKSRMNHGFQKSDWPACWGNAPFRVSIPPNLRRLICHHPGLSDLFVTQEILTI